MRAMRWKLQTIRLALATLHCLDIFGGWPPAPVQNRFAKQSESLQHKLPKKWNFFFTASFCRSPQANKVWGRLAGTSPNVFPPRKKKLTLTLTLTLFVSLSLYLYLYLSLSLFFKFLIFGDVYLDR